MVHNFITTKSRNTGHTYLAIKPAIIRIILPRWADFSSENEIAIDTSTQIEANHIGIPYFAIAINFLITKEKVCNNYVETKIVCKFEI